MTLFLSDRTLGAKESVSSGLGAVCWLILIKVQASQSASSPALASTEVVTWLVFNSLSPPSASIFSSVSSKAAPSFALLLLPSSSSILLSISASPTSTASGGGKGCRIQLAGQEESRWLRLASAVFLLLLLTLLSLFVQHPHAEIEMVSLIEKLLGPSKYLGGIKQKVGK